MITTLSKYGWRLVIDPSEVFPEDPGAGTPLMVYGGVYGDDDRYMSGTYFRVIDTGEIDGEDGELFDVPPAVLRWLKSAAVTAEIDRLIPEL